jgi:TolB-like protein
MRKTLRSVLLIVLAGSFVAGRPLSAQPAPDQSSKGLATPGASVAILDLFNLSNKSEYDSWETLWGRGIRRAAFARKELKVIAYPNIHMALNELKIDDYYIAPEQVPPLGKKLGADFVVLGSFTVSDNMIAASIKVVDGKTGRLLKEETRFVDAGKPNEFISDLSNTLLKILLGSAAVSAPPTGTGTGENPVIGQDTPAPSSPLGLPSGPIDAPIPSAPLEQNPPPVEDVITAPPAEIIGPEEIEGSPMAAPVLSPPGVIPAPAMGIQPPAPAGQPQTFVRPIESEIPSMPRTGTVPSQAVQSPFQPMPVIPAPPPPMRPYSPPPQYQMPSQGNPYAPPMGPSGQQGMAYRSPQQPQPQAYTPSPAAVQEEGRLRRFLNWISRPFRPAENLPPPQVAQPPYTPPASATRNMQQPMAQPMPQPVQTPAPQGNAVTRFFGRLFGGGQ